VLRAKRLKIGVLQGVRQYPPNFHVEGDVPYQSFTYGRLAMSALQPCF